MNTNINGLNINYIDEGQGPLLVMLHGWGSNIDLFAGVIAFAKSKKAKYFISIHINSIASASVSGATVFYPNGNYNAKNAAKGKAIATQIQKQLAALGLKK